MKVFAISLQRFKERYHHLKQHLANFPELEIEIVGVDGGDPTVFPLRSSGEFLPGAVGCTLSHVEIYKRIISEDIPYAFLIEDDAILPKNISEILQTISQIIRPDEVISLYSRTNGAARFSSCDVSQFGFAGFLYPMDLKWLRSAAAYVIGRDAASRYALGNDPVRFLADDWASFYQEGWLGSARLTFPMPVTFTGFESTIEQGNGDGWKNRIRRVIRNIRIFDIPRNIRRRRLLARQESNFAIVDQVSPFAFKRSVEKL